MEFAYTAGETALTFVEGMDDNIEVNATYEMCHMYFGALRSTFVSCQLSARSSTANMDHQPTD